MVEIEEKFAKDHLLETLVIYSKIYGRPYTAEALVSGLPIEQGKPAPELFSKIGSKALFSRAAARAGFKSKIIKIDIDDISPLILPCVLLLKSEDGESIKSCILQSFDETRENVKIILPEFGEAENEVSIETLKKEYYGLSIFLKKKLNHEEHTIDVLDKEQSHWFWGTISQVKHIYRDVIIASLLINIFVLATPLFTMNVYDRVVPNGAIGTLWALSIGILVIYIIDITLKFIRSHFIEVAAKKTDIIISSILFERVMDLRISSMPKSIGSFANILKEFESIRGFLTSSTIALLIDMPFTIIFLITIYYLAGTIVLIPITIMSIILIYTMFMRKKLQNYIKSTYRSSGNKNGILIESLAAIESLKTLGASGYAQWQWEEAVGDISDKSIKTKFLSSSISTITAFLVQLNTVMIIIAGVYMIINMDLTLGGLIATVIISGRAIAPMGQIAGLLASYEHVKTAYGAIEDVMNLEVEHPDGKRFVQRPEYKGIVTFNNVWFTYPEADNASLSDVSFKVKDGEHVALVGKIGSGKSTIQKLILGLYHAQEGSILVDGIDIKQIDPADLRKHIAYVSQDITLFSGTVKDNIIYRAPHADDNMILKAAEISGVIDFVNKHPKGFDMQVGERGSRLSGGQKQSIAIARAILLDSPIVILDEPTSAMDSATEQKIIKNLREYLIGKTMLLVTHKNSLLKLTDRILLFEDGKKMLDGDKETVLNKLSGK